MVLLVLLFKPVTKSASLTLAMFLRDDPKSGVHLVVDLAAQCYTPSGSAPQRTPNALEISSWDLAPWLFTSAMNASCNGSRRRGLFAGAQLPASLEAA